MTHTQLRKALARLYGPGTTYHLAKSFAADLGVSMRTVTYWLEGGRGIPPYMDLLIEALEERR